MYFFVLDFKVLILQVWKVVTKFTFQMNAKTCQNALKSVVTNTTFRCASTLKVWKCNVKCFYSHHDTNINEIIQKTTFTETEKEVVKLKHDVVSLEIVSNLLLEIKKMKSFEDFVNKFIQDGKNNEDIVAVVLVEKSEKVPAAKNENMVDQCGRMNISL